MLIHVQVERGQWIVEIQQDANHIQQDDFNGRLHQSRIFVFHSVAAMIIDTTEVPIQNRIAVSKL